MEPFDEARASKRGSAIFLYAFLVDDIIKSSILKSDMKKPYISIDIEIVTGMKLTPQIHEVQEEGEVVGYDGEKEEIYMTDGKEGWTISKEFEGSLGNIYFK